MKTTVMVGTAVSFDFDVFRTSQGLELFGSIGRARCRPIQYNGDAGRRRRSIGDVSGPSIRM